MNEDEIIILKDLVEEKYIGEHNKASVSYFASKYRDKFNKRRITEIIIKYMKEGYLQCDYQRNDLVFSFIDKDKFNEIKDVIEVNNNLMNKKESNEYDVFISYAGEDRYEVAIPLRNALLKQKKDLKIWFDKTELTIGDSLTQTIDEGLRKSKYGIVIISPSFLNKNWTRKELDALSYREIMNGVKVVLPVWHNIRREDVEKHSLLLASKIAGTTIEGIDTLAKELLLAIYGSEKDKNNIPIQEKIKIIYKFNDISITGDLHKYSLNVVLKLNQPPAINTFKMKIMWPEFIRIVKLFNINTKYEIIKNRRTYLELNLDYNKKIYPGEDVSIVSSNGFGIIEYEFDDSIWDEVFENNVILYYEIYFDDQMPIKNKINFRELNKF